MTGDEATDLLADRFECLGGILQAKWDVVVGTDQFALQVDQADMDVGALDVILEASELLLRWLLHPILAGKS